MEMNDQLLEVVKKNLPEATAGELKKFIEESQTTKAKLLAAEKQIEATKPLLAERDALISEKNSVQSRESSVSAKEKELAKKEIDLQLSAKDQEIKALTEIKNNMFTIMQLFVKNPRSIEIMNESRDVPVFVPSGGGYHQSLQEITHSTTEKLEEKD